jgi:hypothetical protein
MSFRPRGQILWVDNCRVGQGAWNGVEEQGPEGGIVTCSAIKKSISGDAQRGVMMEAAPSAPLVVAETDFLLELLPVGRKSSQ